MFDLEEKGFKLASFGLNLTHIVVFCIFRSSYQETEKIR